MMYVFVSGRTPVCECVSMCVCSHMWMRCVVSADSGRVRGWKGRAGGLRLHPFIKREKNTLWVWKCSCKGRLLKSLCTTLRVRTSAECTAARGQHQTVHVWLVTTTAMSGLCCCFATEWSRGKQYRDSVHVRASTMMFQCGFVKGKYHCFLHSSVKTIWCCIALMVKSGVKCNNLLCWSECVCAECL